MNQPEFWNVELEKPEKVVPSPPRTRQLLDFVTKQLKTLRHEPETEEPSRVPETEEPASTSEPSGVPETEGPAPILVLSGGKFFIPPEGSSVFGITLLCY